IRNDLCVIYLNNFNADMYQREKGYLKRGHRQFRSSADKGTCEKILISLTKMSCKLMLALCVVAAIIAVNDANRSCSQSEVVDNAQCASASNAAECNKAGFACCKIVFNDGKVNYGCGSAAFCTGLDVMSNEIFNLNGGECNNAYGGECNNAYGGGSVTMLMEGSVNKAFMNSQREKGYLKTGHRKFQSSADKATCEKILISLTKMSCKLMLALCVVAAIIAVNDANRSCSQSEVVDNAQCASASNAAECNKAGFGCCKIVFNDGKVNYGCGSAAFCVRVCS
ncbi:unnamed protein product, partial [Owenia fusiformis]